MTDENSRIISRKRIVFKLKPEPRDEREGDQEWKNYTVKEYPELPKWVRFGTIPIVVIPIAFGYWIKVPYLGILLGVGGFVLWGLAFRHRGCPKCKGSVNIREVAEQNDNWRFFFDCPACRISWKGKLQWHSADD